MIDKFSDLRNKKPNHQQKQQKQVVSVPIMNTKQTIPS